MSTGTAADSRAATRAVRAGIDRDTAFGAVTPPLVLSSNFSFAGFNDKRAYDYTRSGNPTRDLLGEALAELEGGAGGVVTATGMARDHAGAARAAAAGRPRWWCRTTATAAAGGCSTRWRSKGAFELVDSCDLTDPRALAAALARRAALVWIETPSNPLLRITDLRLVIEAAHAAGALAVVDNTFLSPALQRPIELRRRRGGALDHQVHQRPQRRGRRRGGGARRRRCTSSWRGGRTRWA